MKCHLLWKLEFMVLRGIRIVFSATESCKKNYLSKIDKNTLSAKWQNKQMENVASLSFKMKKTGGLRWLTVRCSDCYPKSTHCSGRVLRWGWYGIWKPCVQRGHPIPFERLMHENDWGAVRGRGQGILALKKIKSWTSPKSYGFNMMINDMLQQKKLAAMTVCFHWYLSDPFSISPRVDSI